MRTMRTLPPLIMIILLTSGEASANQGAAAASADAARGLVSALEGSGLNAIATADPESGGFVAALYVPGSQLLVVSANHPSVDGIAYRLAMREYREVYRTNYSCRMRGQTAFAAHDGAAATSTSCTRTAPIRPYSMATRRGRTSPRTSMRPGWPPPTRATPVCCGCSHRPSTSSRRRPVRCVRVYNSAAWLTVAECLDSVCWLSH